MKRAFSAAFAFVVLFVTIMTNYSQFTFASAKDEPTKVAILNEGNDVFWEEIEESTDAVYDDYEPDFSNVEITEIEVPQISTGPSRSLTTMSVSFTDAQGEQIRVSGTAPKYSLVKFYKGSSLLGSLESDQYGVFQGYITIPGKQSGAAYAIKAVCVSDDVTYETEGYIAIDEEAPKVSGLKYYDSVNSDENIDLYEKMTEGDDIWVGYFGNDEPFRFVIEFTNPEAVAYASIIAIKDGTRYRLDATYDETIGGFVAEGYFDGTDKKFSPDEISVEYSAASHPDRTVREIMDIGEGSDIYDMVHEQYPNMQVEKSIRDENGTAVTEVICSYLNKTPEEGVIDNVKYAIKTIDFATGMEFYDQYSKLMDHLSYVVDGINDKKYLVDLDLSDPKVCRMLLIDTMGGTAGTANEIILSCFNVDNSEELPLDWIDFSESLDDISSVLGVVGALNKVYTDTQKLEETINNATYLSEEEKSNGIEMARTLGYEKAAFKILMATLPLMIFTGGMSAPVTLFSTMLAGMGMLSDMIYDKRVDMLKASMIPVDWNKNFGSYQLTSDEGMTYNVEYSLKREDYIRYIYPWLLGDVIPIKDYRIYMAVDVTVSGNGFYHIGYVDKICDVIQQQIEELYGSGHLSHSIIYKRLDLKEGIVGVAEFGGYEYHQIIMPSSLTVIKGVANGPLYSAGPGTSYDVCIRFEEEIPSGFSTCFPNINTIKLPMSIKRIGERALVFNDVEELIIPSSVEFIGRYAIGGNSLKKVVFNSEFEFDVPFLAGGQYLKSAGTNGTNLQFCWTDKIPDYLLYRSNIERVDIPASVETIGDYAFAECTDLQDLFISERDLIIIGEAAFRGCSSLSSIEVFANILRFHYEAFKKCNRVSKLIFPAVVSPLYNSIYSYTSEALNREDWSDRFSYSLSDFRGNLTTAGPYGDETEYDFEFLLDESVPDYYFEGFHNLETVVLPDSIQEIGYRSFSDTGSLKYLELPDSLTRIGSWAFEYSGISSIELPDSLTKMGWGVFRGSALESIRLSPSVEELSVTPAYPYYWDLGRVGVFSECTNLKSIIIPEGVKIIGDEAFYNSGLETITLPSSLQEIGGAAFEGTNIRSIDLPSNLKVIGGAAFYETLLTSIDLPNHLERIGNSAFAGTQITRVVLPDSLEVIGEEAFAGTQITRVVLPDSLEVIGEEAFADTPLQEAVLNSNFSIGRNAFPDETVLTFGLGITTIPDTMFKDNKNIKSFKIPDHIIEIGDEAFAGCTNLSQVEMSEGLLSIGDSAFYNTGLIDVSIPDSVESIGKYAFSKSVKLTSVTIGENLQTIEEYVFKDCDSLSVLNYNAIHLLSVGGEKNLLRDAADGGLDIVFGEKVEYLPSDLFCWMSTLVPSWAPVFSINSIDFKGSKPEMEISAIYTPECVVYYPADDHSWDYKPFFYGDENVTWIGKKPEFYARARGEESLIYINPGDPATLEIEAYSPAGELKYQWFDTKGNAIKNADTASLYVAGTYKNSIYSCKVSDPTGSVITVPFSIEIPDEIFIVRKSPESGFGLSNKYQSIDLIVEAQSVIGDIRFDWYKKTSDGDLISVNCHDSKYTVNNLEEDSVFVCFASDKYGNNNSVDFTVFTSGFLTVNDEDGLITVDEEHPEIIKKIEHFMYVKADSSVQLHVDATVQNGTIHYEWYKDGSIIDNAEEANYTIDRFLDPAEYSCIVSDDFGRTIAVSYFIYEDYIQYAYPEGSDTWFTYLPVKSGEGIELFVNVLSEWDTNDFAWGYYDSNYQFHWLENAENSNSYYVSNVESNIVYGCYVNYESDDYNYVEFRLFVDSGDEGIPINETNFPDQKLRKIILNDYDRVSDGLLKDYEIQDVNVMDLSNAGISSLKGIEYFTELKGLYCSHNNLTSLDLSELPALYHLYCSYNRLTTLDINNQPELRTLYCDNNKISSLNLTDAASLTFLYCNNNELSSLDLSGVDFLLEVDCSCNNLQTIDSLWNCSILDCHDNQLTEIDAETSNLRKLICYHNNISYISLRWGSPLETAVKTGEHYYTNDFTVDNYYYRNDAIPVGSKDYNLVIDRETIVRVGYDYNCNHLGKLPVKESIVEGSGSNPGSYDSVVYCRYCGTELSRTHIVGTTEPIIWDDPEYTWADDNSTVTAEVHRIDDASIFVKETVDTTTRIETPVQCTKNGVTVYVAEFSNDLFDTQEQAVIIPKTGHTPGSTVDWFNYEATCEKDGQGRRLTYCSNCFCLLSEELYAIPATGHDWDEIEYTWADDYSSALASAYCRNERLYYSETVESTIIEVHADCTKPGSITYLAHFENEAFTDQSISFETTYGDHDIECIDRVEPTCDEPGNIEYYHCKLCDKYFMDSYGIAEIEEEDAIIDTLGHSMGEEVIENETQEDCEHDGGYDSVIYCSRCGEEISRSRIIYSAYGHKWGEPEYEWSDDDQFVTATRTCQYDPSHVDTETVATTNDATPATCTEGGTVHYEARFKNPAYETQYRTEQIEAEGHKAGKIIRENEVAATCTEEGHYDEVSCCVVCGTEFSRQRITVEPIGHDYQAVVTKEATCKETGVMTYTCSHDSSHTYTEAIPKKDHTPDDPVQENVTGGSCTEPGSYDLVTYCDVCGEELSREHKETETLGHDWEEWIITKEATCKEAGEQVRTCKRDSNHKETQEIPKLEHTIEIIQGKEATCTESGLTEGQKCSVCGEILVAQEEIPATGHDWGEWYVIKEATEEEEGLEGRTCANDPSHTETRTIPVLTHQHDLQKTDAKEATCSEEGRSEYWTCSGCGKYFSDEDGTEEIEKDSWIIPRKEHTVETLPGKEATCTETGLTEGSRCSVCGEILTAQETIPAKGHAYGDWVVTKEATYEEDGSREKTCSHCGDKIVEVIPKLSREGWVTISGKRYFYVNGKAKTKWHSENGKWYYLNPDDGGAMAIGICKAGDAFYYMNQEGVMQTGWIKDGDIWYYANTSGALAAGWLQIGPTWYYMDPNSFEMQVGWVTIGKTKYYMAQSGAMVTGWVKDGENWYFMNSSGAMATGWVKSGTTWYYMDNDGVMQTGWVTINGTKYYMASSGAMLTGWVKDGGIWYYMNSSGAMVTNWVKVGNTWYFFKADGAMAANEWVTGYYWISASGAWTYQPVGSWKKNDTGWWFGDTSGWYAKNETLKINDVLYTFNAAGYWVE